VKIANAMLEHIAVLMLLVTNKRVPVRTTTCQLMFLNKTYKARCPEISSSGVSLGSHQVKG
jgi:hypothetical protein